MLSRPQYCRLAFSHVDAFHKLSPFVLPCGSKAPRLERNEKDNPMQQRAFCGSAVSQTNRATSPLGPHTVRRIWHGSRLLLILLASGFAGEEQVTAQSPAASFVSPNSASTSSQGALLISDIVAMHESGLGEGVIVRMVQDRGVSQSPSVQDLIGMHRRGLSTRVIESVQEAAPRPVPHSANAQRAAPPPVVSSPPVHIYEPVPPAVIVRPCPRYYYRPGPYVPFHHPWHYRPHYYHSRGPRVSLGIRF